MGSSYYRRDDKAARDRNELRDWYSRLLKKVFGTKRGPGSTNGPEPKMSQPDREIRIAYYAIIAKLHCPLFDCSPWQRRSRRQ